MGSSNEFSVWKLYFWRKSKHITIPAQSYHNLPEKKLWRISKNWIIVTLFCCVLQQTWRQFGPGVWCLFINISGHTVWKKKEKTLQILCNKKRIFKQIVWTEMFSYQTNSGRWTTVHLSVYDFVWQSVSYLTLACTDVGWLTKNIEGQINVFGMLVFHQLIFMVNFPKIWNERILWITTFIWSQQSSFQLTQFLPMFTPFSFDMKHQTDIHVWYMEIS